MTKVKAKRQSTGNPQKRGFPWTWVIIALFSATFVSIFVVNSQQIPSPIPEGARAAIVDQLYASYPNQEFTTKVTKELEDYGFEVDLYQGDDVTVDFYRQLSNYKYDLIIFRAHSGLLGSEGGTIKRTCLFTNEPYSQTKHIAEQLSDQLAKARIDENHPWVFGIGDEFVTQSMQGKFENTVIVMMGCSCLYIDDLAQAFVDRGASAYLAWDATVDLDYVDEATVSLIKNLCSERLTVEKAVDLTMATEGPDPKYGAVLKYYPRGQWQQDH